MVPLVEPLLIEPEVPDEPVAFPDAPVLVAGPDMLLLLLPGIASLFEPIGDDALTPLPVEVAESLVCANAIPDVAKTVHKMVVINKRDIILSPD